MIDRIWTDLNQPTKMSNRHDCIFPVTETIQMIDGNGNPLMEQKTIGGHTKFESTVNAIAQGYAQNTQQFTNADEAADYIIELSTKIHERLEIENK